MLFLTFLNVNHVHAAPLAARPEQEVPFFKTPQSLFPSGSSHRNILEKSLLLKKALAEKKYKWNNKLFNRDELKPVRPIHLSKSIVDPKTQNKLRVVQTTVQTLFVLNPNQPQKNSFSVDEALTDPNDLGFALTMKEVAFKKKATNNSATLLNIPIGTRLAPIAYQDGYAYVIYKSTAGYVNLSEIMSKFDFATMVYADNRWQLVKQREYDFMITVDHKKIQLNKIKGIVTPENKGIIASSNQKIPLWSLVEIVNPESSIWVQSYLKGHGLVWWRLEEENNHQNELTIDELLKRNIASVSFHPKDPLKGILSANGVYTTKNGTTWKKLTQFGDFNGPVHYFNDLLLFVGNYRSVDGGEHFDNYIQLDKLTVAIEKQLGYQPKKLQVKQIQTLAPYRLKIQVDTGVRSLEMESPLFSQDWRVSKNKFDKPTVF